jgi:hypothetical protein
LSDTPRADAAIVAAGLNSPPTEPIDWRVVGECARQLERENRRLIAALKLAYARGGCPKSTREEILALLTELEPPK